MMIKVGDSFLDFDGSISIEKQIFDFSTLETAGTFAYSFTVKDTSYNRDKLGILDISSNTNCSLVEDVGIYTDSGNLLYLGFITIDDPLNIECSFFSDNNNFFAAIEGKVNEVEDLSDYNVLLSETAIINSWTATSGIVFPLTDRGGLSERKDPFMKLRMVEGRLDQNDWQPFIFVKDVITKILQKANLKISGDLIKDPTYNQLITTNNSVNFKNILLKKQEVYVGTETVQNIPNGVANIVKVNFDLVNTLPFFNSELNSFDSSLSRWTATYDSSFYLHVNAIVDDASKEIHWQIRRNGVDARTYFTRSTSVSFIYSKGESSEAHADAGQYYELWAYVDAGTPGSANLVSANIKTEIKWSNMCFGQALVPNIKSTDFISDIFKMFNVVASYDSFTKTIETTLYRNIKDKEEQDLSDYVVGISSMQNFDLISGYGQSNILKYDELDSDDIRLYNESNVIPYGGGEITINNRVLEKSVDIVSLNFKAPFIYKNNAFGLYLIKLDYVSYVHVSGAFEASVTSVTDSAGLAQFNTSGADTFYNNNFVDNATGTYQSIGGASDGFSRGGIVENNVEDQIIALYLPNVTLPNSFRFSASGDNGSVVASNGNWGIGRLSEMTTPVYNGDWEKTGFPSATRTNAGVAIFSKAQDGTPLDSVRQGLSFGDLQGLNSLTLKQTYYKEIESSLNDPVKPIIEMAIPEKVFMNLDLTRPVRIKTDRINSLFVCNKLTGYEDSVITCTLELIKLP